MLVIGTIAVFLIIILIDIGVLLKTNHKIKTMIVYFSLILVGFTISILQVVDKAPQSPSIIIEKIVKLIIPGG
ncbi:hypothetical protein [Petroclostridium sp. X23]|uniref:hypothetical protein n=1 Tax=Petroclostridium sp. X23 TaxID=3045146 RepID=UPI0024AE385B|nr:hypothetical protein [Petroclostridium sp. X23]WHH61156.1 hypothetical protein QKW49_10830 [Petroclostridium sp. X23]